MPYSQPSGTYNDQAEGSMPFGSQVVTIPDASGVAYIANSINIKRPTKVITGKNEFDVPIRETVVKDTKTGDMELQLATVETAAPSIGAKFKLAKAGSGTTPVYENFKVTDVGEKFTASCETMVSVSFRQLFGALA